ncbi:MAG: hypothetical protein QXO15_00930 [Nitrososphaerota archaeon]
MIKLKQVSAVHGEMTLIFDVDFPDGSLREVQIQADELIERLKALKQLVGRELTSKDVKDIIIAIVNQMREGRRPLIERFDFMQYLGVDFEQ